MVNNAPSTQATEAAAPQYYDIIGRRGVAFWISGIIIAIGIVSFAARGFNFGIDFRGGFLLHLQFKDNVKEADIRTTIAQEKFHISAEQVQVQMVVHDLSSKESNEFIVYIPKSQAEMEEMGKGAVTEGDRVRKINETITQIKEELTEKLKVEKILRQEFVGPAIGDRLRSQAMWATLVALIGIVLYVSFRFDLRFAIAAIIALIHDVWVTLAIFSLFQVEISLTFVAAILTIIGYSLNDTIVISDRIRENIKLLRKKPFEEMVNISINQSLSRTINTSVTTFIPVLILFLFGGAILHAFAFAMLIGVVVGTYSSVFVVSPVVIAWKQYDDAKMKTSGNR